MPLIKNFEKTKYPEIYKDTYWGNLEYGKDAAIIDARNIFVEKHKIVKSSVMRYQLLEESLEFPFLPHHEIYLTLTESIIFIYSPYEIDQKFRDFNKSEGFEEIDSLYHEMAKTYLLELPNIEVLKFWVKNFKIKPVYPYEV